MFRKVLVILLLLLPQMLSAAEEPSWIGYPEAETPLLGREITVRKGLDRATLQICGLGFYEAYIDGQKIGKDVLSPNESAYGRRGEKINSGAIPMDDSRFRGCRVYFVTHDITKALRKKGTHLLEAELGNGFYNSDANRFVSSYGKPRLWCRLKLEYGDGKTVMIVSDTTWKARKSPTVLNDIFLGEIFDARLKEDPSPVSARMMEAPEGELYGQTGPADRVIRTLRPVRLKKLEDGRWEADFGEYVSGRIRLHDFTIGRGDSIDITFPIEEKGNGVYRYISDGSRCREYAPKFAWWMFRKAVIRGWKGEMKPENITAEVIHSDIASSARFECSDTTVNRIVEMWRRTELCNMHVGVPTDCPHREKGPYTGDGQVSSTAVMHNFHALEFYRKWLRDMRDCQDTVTGYVPNGAPWHPACGGGVAWGAAMSIIPWVCYVHYGDLSILEENLEAMAMQTRFLAGWRDGDGTVFQQLPSPEKPKYWMNLGEWCPPYSLVGERLVHTWYLWRCADYTAKAASALGRKETESEFRKIADDTWTAFHRRFWDPAKHSYGCGLGKQGNKNYGTGTGGGEGDGSNIFALAMGVPEERTEEVLGTVRKELETNNGHLNTGIFGTSLFFEVLCRYGMAQEAYEAFVKPDFPGYALMLREGPGTMWEQWNGKNSRCHPMFGGGIVWLYRHLAGLTPLEPGYRKVLFSPTPVRGIDWVKYTLETPHGKIEVGWKRLRNGKISSSIKAPKDVEVVFRTQENK